MSETVEERIARVLPTLAPEHIPGTAAALKKNLVGIEHFGELIPSDSEQFQIALAKALPPEARPAPPPIPTNAEKLRAEAQAQVRSKFSDEQWFGMQVSEKERLIRAVERSMGPNDNQLDHMVLEQELTLQGALKEGKFVEVDPNDRKALGDRALQKLKWANSAQAAGVLKPVPGTTWKSLSEQFIRLRAGEVVLNRRGDALGTDVNRRGQNSVLQQMRSRDSRMTEAFLKELNK